MRLQLVGYQRAQLSGYQDLFVVQFVTNRWTIPPSISITFCEH